MASSYDTYPDGDDGEDGRSGGFAEQIDLQHFLRVLRKHKWGITLFTTAITALATYYAMTATPIYSATSTLLIESQKANIVSIEEMFGVDQENADYYGTQFELLRSRQLAIRVIDTLGLWNDPEISGGTTGPTGPSGASAIGAGGVVDVPTGGTSDLPGGAGGGAAVTDATGTATTERGADEPSASGADAVDRSIASLAPPDAGDREAEDARRQAVVGRFMSRVTIAPVRKTKLVKISYDSADPKLAATVANTMGEQYILSYLDAKMEMTSKASSWLNGRLGELRTTLDESEDRLIAFKQDNGLVDVDGSVGRLNEQELLLLTTELSTARSELSNVTDLRREVQALRGSPQLLLSIPAIQGDSLIQQVKIEQGAAQRELDELTNRYGERHPRIIDAQSKLRSLETTLQGHIDRVVGAVEQDYQFVRQRVASIESKLASGKQEIQSIGTKRFELEALEREVATNQEIYNTFFNSISEARSADGLETANARISDYAVAPNEPVRPKKQMIIALAALASLVLSMVMALLYEQMDDTIKSTNDIEDKLGVNLLGILPLVNGGMFKRKTDLPLDPTEIADEKGTFAESVNTVRTALSLDERDGPRKVVVVTSSVPGEGKSTTAINLAHSLAQLERVLLIDCDMRRPTMAKALDLDKGSAGLSSLIVGSASARQCIRRGVFGTNLDVITSGPIPDQPLELLSSKRFLSILEQLKDHYDRIVIDSAPVQAVSDALVLSRIADAVTYVVKSHDTSFEIVRRGLQRLQEARAPLAGVVITQVDMNKITAYGGDYYYQGYYDYYGYSEDGGKKGRGTGAPSTKFRLSREELAALSDADGGKPLDLGDPPGGGGTSAPAPRPRRERPAAVDARDDREVARRSPAAARRMGADLDIL